MPGNKAATTRTGKISRPIACSIPKMQRRDKVGEAWLRTPVLPMNLPLPFRRGEGWGEGSAFSLAFREMLEVGLAGDPSQVWARGMVTPRGSNERLQAADSPPSRVSR